MKIIGISGQAGVGKDFLTKNLLVPMIAGNRPYAILSFADHFKIEAIVKEGLDPAKVYGKKDKKTREILQRKGTEEGRDVFGPNIWVDLLDQRISQYQQRGIEYVFVTDCRFPNEVDYFEKKGAPVIRIDAPDRHLAAMEAENGADAKVLAHSSETALKDRKWKYLIDNRVGGRDVADQVMEIAREIRESWRVPVTVFVNWSDVNRETFLKIQEKYSHVVVLSDNPLQGIVNLFRAGIYGIPVESCATSSQDLIDKYPSSTYIFGKPFVH